MEGIEQWAEIRFHFVHYLLHTLLRLTRRDIHHHEAFSSDSCR